MAKNQLEKDLMQIGETYDSFTQLNKLFKDWGKKHDWYIVINRVPKKGWIVFGMKGLTQHTHEIGLDVVEKYFDEPISMLNKFVNLAQQNGTN